MWQISRHRSTSAASARHSSCCRRHLPRRGSVRRRTQSRQPFAYHDHLARGWSSRQCLGGRHYARPLLDHRRGASLCSCRRQKQGGSPWCSQRPSIVIPAAAKVAAARGAGGRRIVPAAFGGDGDGRAAPAVAVEGNLRDIRPPRDVALVGDAQASSIQVVLAEVPEVPEASGATRAARGAMGGVRSWCSSRHASSRSCSLCWQPSR